MEEKEKKNSQISEQDTKDNEKNSQIPEQEQVSRDERAVEQQEAKIEKKKNTDSHSEKEKDSRRPFLYVAIGASAGGLEALEEFFSNMPSDSNLAFIVVQHLSPDYKSMMVELLSRRTEMQVFRAKDGLVVEPNCIYLIPPKKNLTIFHGKLYLTAQDNNRELNLPIDILFRSLAVDQEKNAIAIILSGTGSDGTLGIRAIKEVGGMVMVQDFRTAKFDGMPKSAIATGLVDYILPSGEMPAALIKYVKHPLIRQQKAEREGQNLTETSLPKILGIIRSHVGVDFTYYKPNTIIRRIERRVSINQLEGMEQYVNLLSRSKSEAEILYKELLIGVTQFFRDPEAYKVLEEQVVPSIFERRPKEKPIRVWSAASSTGEEAYSLAILFREYMDRNEIELDVKVFATDLDSESIEFAGIGTYPESIVSDVSPERLENYFVKKQSGYQVNETVRRMVVFAKHNIIKDPPFSKIDLICCRNLLIYFKSEMQKRVLSMFHYSISQEGYLFLGSSESLNELSEVFSTVHSKWKIFKYKEGYKPPGINELTIMPQSQNYRIPQTDNVGVKTKLNSKLMDDLYEQILEDFAPPSVLINYNDEIIHVFGDVNPYLKLPSGKVRWDISELIRPELSLVVSNLLHKIKKEKKDVSYRNFIIRNQENEEVFAVDISARYFSNRKFKQNFIIVSFEKRDTTVKETEVIETDFNIESQAKERIAELERELQHRDESLQTTIEELETSNEELQATNEELVSSNEELQSTNEELQSVNEELYTVNSEYQKKIQDLTVLNNDMNNLLNNTNIGTLFLDSKLLIRKFTPAITKIINVLEIDLGRPISHISYNSDYNNLYDDVKEVMRTLKAKNIEVQDLDKNWYLLKIQPYRESDNSVNGVIITLVDITELKQAVQALSATEERLSLALGIGNIAWWDWDYPSGHVSFSAKKAKMLGYDPSEIQPNVYAFTRMIHPDDYDETMKIMRDHLEGKTQIYEAEYRIKSKDGSWKWFYDRGGVIIRDQEKKPVRVIGIVFDITERKNAEIKLKNIHNLLTNVLDNSPTAYVITDEKGQFVYANRPAEEILEMPGSQILEKGYFYPDLQIQTQDGNLISEEKLPVNLVLKQGSVLQNYTHILKTENNRKILLSINGTPAFDNNGAITGAIFSLKNAQKEE